MAEIALFGANGTIGSRVLREALDRGHRVTAVVRDPGKLVAGPHANLAVVPGDVLDPESVAAAARGHDVLLSAVGGGDGPGHLATIEPAARSLVRALRSLGSAAPRLIAVGGAGSLRMPDGQPVWDSPGLPAFVLQMMHAHGDALDYYRTVRDVAWTVVSPAAAVEPGERTGAYRAALDDLVVAADGASFITAEDFAVAVVDEVEVPAHVGERFAVGT